MICDFAIRHILSTHFHMRKLHFCYHAIDMGNASPWNGIPYVGVMITWHYYTFSNFDHNYHFELPRWSWAGKARTCEFLREYEKGY